MVLVRAYTTLALGMAQSKSNSRAALLRFYPLLVLSEAIASGVNFRGPTGLGYVQSVVTEYIIAFGVWCILAWPYVFAYRFYRSVSSDVLFSRTDIVTPEIDDAKNQTSNF